MGVKGELDGDGMCYYSCTTLVVTIHAQYLRTPQSYPAGISYPRVRRVPLTLTRPNPLPCPTGRGFGGYG